MSFDAAAGLFSGVDVREEPRNTDWLHFEKCLGGHLRQLKRVTVGEHADVVRRWLRRINKPLAENLRRPASLYIRAARVLQRVTRRWLAGLAVQREAVLRLWQARETRPGGQRCIIEVSDAAKVEAIRKMWEKKRSAFRVAFRRWCRQNIDVDDQLCSQIRKPMPLLAKNKRPVQPEIEIPHIATSPPPTPAADRSFPSIKPRGDTGGGVSPGSKPEKRMRETASAHSSPGKGKNPRSPPRAKTTGGATEFAAVTSPLLLPMDMEEFSRAFSTATNCMTRTLVTNRLTVHRKGRPQFDFLTDFRPPEQPWPHLISTALVCEARNNSAVSSTMRAANVLSTGKHALNPASETLRRVTKLFKMQLYAQEDLFEFVLGLFRALTVTETPTLEDINGHVRYFFATAGSAEKKEGEDAVAVEGLILALRNCSNWMRSLKRVEHDEGWNDAGATDAKRRTKPIAPSIVPMPAVPQVPLTRTSTSFGSRSTNAGRSGNASPAHSVGSPSSMLKKPSWFEGRHAPDSPSAGVDGDERLAVSSSSSSSVGYKYAVKVRSVARFKLAGQGAAGSGSPKTVLASRRRSSEEGEGGGLTINGEEIEWVEEQVFADPRSPKLPSQRCPSTGEESEASKPQYLSVGVGRPPQSPRSDGDDTPRRMKPIMRATHSAVRFRRTLAMTSPSSEADDECPQFANTHRGFARASSPRNSNDNDDEPRLHRQSSMQRQPSLNRQHSLQQRQPSLQRQNSLHRQPSFQRQQSMQRQPSLHRHQSRTPNAAGRSEPEQSISRNSSQFGVVLPSQWPASKVIALSEKPRLVESESSDEEDGDRRRLSSVISQLLSRPVVAPHSILGAAASPAMHAREPVQPDDGSELSATLQNRRSPRMFSGEGAHCTSSPRGDASSCLSDEGSHSKADAAELPRGNTQSRIPRQRSLLLSRELSESEDDSMILPSSLKSLPHSPFERQPNSPSRLRPKLSVDTGVGVSPDDATLRSTAATQSFRRIVDASRVVSFQPLSPSPPDSLPAKHRRTPGPPTFETPSKHSPRPPSMRCDSDMSR
ncbi:hypothetical protein DIPPA_35325 [Diplonema papillatum]|nr:hypothetical protein DIPPA_35325 [Diplonema papillatum]